MTATTTPETNSHWLTRARFQQRWQHPVTGQVWYLAQRSSNGEPARDLLLEPGPPCSAKWGQVTARDLERTQVEAPASWGRNNAGNATRQDKGRCLPAQRDTWWDSERGGSFQDVLDKEMGGIYEGVLVQHLQDTHAEQSFQLTGQNSPVQAQAQRLALGLHNRGVAAFSKDMCQRLKTMLQGELIQAHVDEESYGDARLRERGTDRAMPTRVRMDDFQQSAQGGF